VPGDRPFSAVVEDILINVRELLRSEIRLARTEIREALWLASGAVVILSSWIFLLWTCAYALSAIMPIWAATLVVALATAVCGSMLTVVGVRRIKRVTPVPDRTIDSLKENLKWIRQPTE
jgi:hypothetical protein